MKRVLDRFHHKVARRVTGWQPRKGRYKGWFYPPLEYAMAEAGLQEMETYVSGRQNTVRLRPPEHRSTIYCDYTYYGPESGGKAEARAKGGNAVEVTFSDRELRGSVIA